MYAKVTVTPKFTSFILDISFSNDDVHYRHKDEDKKIRLYIIFTHRKKIYVLNVIKSHYYCQKP